MDSEAAVTALVAWVPTVIPEVAGRVYDHVPAAKPLGLPDVVIESARTGIEPGGSGRFAFWQLQQAVIYFVEASVSVMVDNDDTALAARLLRSMEARLLRSVLEDTTLGQRVPFTSPLVEFDFTGPYVEYEDGTRGREMTMTLAVGDLVEAS